MNCLRKRIEEREREIGAKREKKNMQKSGRNESRLLGDPSRSARSHHRMTGMEILRGKDAFGTAPGLRDSRCSPETLGFFYKRKWQQIFILTPVSEILPLVEIVVVFCCLDSWDSS